MCIIFFFIKKVIWLIARFSLYEYEQIVFFDVVEKEHIKMVRILAFWYTFNMVSYDKITKSFDKHLFDQIKYKRRKRSILWHKIEKQTPELHPKWFST